MQSVFKIVAYPLVLNQYLDVMGDQQFWNLAGPLNQQHFIVTKLQCTYLLHSSAIYHIMYSTNLSHEEQLTFLGGPTDF